MKNCELIYCKDCPHYNGEIPCDNSKFIYNSKYALIKANKKSFDVNKEINNTLIILIIYLIFIIIYFFSSLFIPRML
jgi:hypothetical protein